jgi:hypothetical protein
MMKMKLYFLFILILSSGAAIAQTSNGMRNEEGKVEIIADPKIEELLKRHRALNETRQVLDGYRVQIFFASGTNSKKQATDTKTAFMQKYPDVPSYITYQAPNFKVRVGDFRTRHEAHRLFKEIRKDFPGAFIVKDEINFPAID